MPELNAAVPFYGRHADVAAVANIKAPLLIHLASEDEHINAGWPDYERALKKYGKSFAAASTQKPNTASITTLPPLRRSRR